MRHDDTLILDEAESMGRPPKANKLGNPTNIRFSNEQLERIDKLRKDKRGEWTANGVPERTEFIRHLIDIAIKTLEGTMLGFPKRRR
jgi:hypothetical protein